MAYGSDVAEKLAGLAEVAELLGVHKNTALRYAKRADFPKPVDRLAATPVWCRDEVEAWKAAEHEPPLAPGRPRKRSPA